MHAKIKILELLSISIIMNFWNRELGQVVDRIINYHQDKY